MPSTIVATPGASTANSYVTVLEADTYFGDRPESTAWTGATADQKATALIYATRRIDQETFKGHPRKPLADREATGDVQALKWPRYGVESEDGWWYDDDQVPNAVKRATMEAALAMLAGGFDLEDTGLEGFEKVVVGPLEVTPRHGRIAGVLPSVVLRELRDVIDTPSPMNFRIGRG